jgi:superfamily II DNA or RNA helicase
MPRLEILTAQRCRLVGLSDETAKLLDDALSLDTPGKRWNPSVKAGHWDGKRHLYSIERGTFPHGLLERVGAFLEEAGVSYRVVDRRVDVPPTCDLTRLSATMLQGIELRDYQLKAVRRAVQRQRGLLHLATNSGKSEVACAVMKVLSEQRVLFLVHTKALLNQTRKRIAERLGTIEEHIGIIGDGRFEPRHITVATIQSLTRKTDKAKAKIIAKYIKTIQLLFGDEVHHAKAATFYRFIQRVPARFRIGMSGTPFAGENALLVEAAFGPVVSRVSNETLIKRGISAKPTIEMIPIHEPVIEASASWDQVYKEGIVNNVARNAAIAQIAAAKAKAKQPTMILLKELWHGDLVSTMLKELGVRHHFVHGRMPSSAVEEQKHRFEAGKFYVLIASPIFGEGVDCPIIRTLIMADGGKSIRKVLQQIGRGLRKKHNGVNTLDVIDFADYGHEWLAEHTQERLAIYTAEKFDVRARR